MNLLLVRTINNVLEWYLDRFGTIPNFVIADSYSCKAISYYLLLFLFPLFIRGGQGGVLLPTHFAQTDKNTPLSPLHKWGNCPISPFHKRGNFSIPPLRKRG
jgi:hypothetical protein